MEWLPYTLKFQEMQAHSILGYIKKTLLFADLHKPVIVGGAAVRHRFTSIRRKK
jgi:hypothetical protein